MLMFFFPLNGVTNQKDLSVNKSRCFSLYAALDFLSLVDELAFLLVGSEGWMCDTILLFLRCLLDCYLNCDLATSVVVERQKKSIADVCCYYKLTVYLFFFFSLQLQFLYVTSLLLGRE